ncbi:MAG: ribosome biogenesis GTP-binding protein YihA/YsxC [Bacteroidales bacterium]|jgi:GTP-binding protein|nr:ribosome biogenesis GTP-binding protein YihA/YsxC [Bacteroidales bacterium]NLM92407.1 YihA family ribosome biogenesis GTP-binding protein [Bacteroidales bacterium]
MVIRSAEFIKSSPSLNECPESTLPEYAFIGRSNVGKSSLINTITGFSKLAKISSSPGKTQLINHFLINEAWYLTDLPGFGFAKVPVRIKRKWDLMIRNYLLKRPNLVCSFLLIDIRHEALKNDLEFMAWMGGRRIPFYLIFTKADKLTHNQRQSAIAAYMKVLGEQWEPLPPFLVTSSDTGMGREELLALIETFNNGFQAEGLG